MSIQEFHTRVQSADSTTPLFAALRQLNEADDPRQVLHASTVDASASWQLWTDFGGG